MKVVEFKVKREAILSEQYGNRYWVINSQKQKANIVRKEKFWYQCKQQWNRENRRNL